MVHIDISGDSYLFPQCLRADWLLKYLFILLNILGLPLIKKESTLFIHLLRAVLKFNTKNPG